MGIGNMVKKSIWVLAMVVFWGTILIWIMLPTNTYRQNWIKKIRTNTYSTTYFGSQGTMFLMYVFPTLFMAVLGCIYIHLQGKKNLESPSNSKSKEHGAVSSRVAMLKKPMLVKGPLGIVSAIEVGLFLMFIALLIWSLSTALQISYKNINPAAAAKKGQKVWQMKLSSLAVRLGIVGNICLAFLFYPVSRGSSVLPLFGLTSEGSVKYHIWLGHLSMLLFTAHSVCYIIYWASINKLSLMLEWEKADISNVAGEIAILAGLVMWATTFPKIRRKFFELFLYTHYFYIAFMIFYFFHVGISYACYILPGFYLFVIDRYLRFLQSRQRVRLVSSRVLPGSTLELNFSKTPGLKYCPTSIMFINVPSISKLQWHPFTISSNSSLEPEKLSTIIKIEGTWSSKLYNMLSSPTNSLDRLEVAVEGPYGPASTNFLKHDTLVMVSGGSGITPFISIIRELVFIKTTFGCKTPRVILISAFKNSQDLNMLKLIVPLNGSASCSISNLDMEIKAFVTREKEANTESSSKKPISTKWFKPLPTDSPVTPILGPNSWIWLGMIISSSFMMYLIVIGLITRYYIYPIDHNTGDEFSWSWKAFLNMLMMCVSIAIAASVALVFNKRQTVREGKQIQNMEGGTPMGTPNTPHNADREMELELELESLPEQPLVETTNVHYGERPNLKRMLLECEGTSVGVLVSGPATLRQEVASICSSGLVEKLHFESISFNW